MAMPWADSAAAKDAPVRNVIPATAERIEEKNNGLILRTILRCPYFHKS
jgi:hypothetical protein